MPIVNGFIQIKSKERGIYYLRAVDISYVHEEHDRVYVTGHQDWYLELEEKHFPQSEILKFLGLLGIVPEVYGVAPPEEVNADSTSA